MRTRPGRRVGTPTGIKTAGTRVPARQAPPGGLGNARPRARGCGAGRASAPQAEPIMTATRFPAGATRCHTGGAARAGVTRPRGMGRADAEAATAASAGRGWDAGALTPDHHEHQAGHLQVSARRRGRPGPLASPRPLGTAPRSAPGLGRPWAASAPRFPARETEAGADSRQVAQRVAARCLRGAACGGRRVGAEIRGRRGRGGLGAGGPAGRAQRWGPRRGRARARGRGSGAWSSAGRGDGGRGRGSSVAVCRRGRRAGSGRRPMTKGPEGAGARGGLVPREVLELRCRLLVRGVGKRGFGAGDDHGGWRSLRACFQVLGTRCRRTWHGCRADRMPLYSAGRPDGKKLSDTLSETAIDEEKYRDDGCRR